MKKLIVTTLLSLFTTTAFAEKTLYIQITNQGGFLASTEITALPSNNVVYVSPTLTTGGNNAAKITFIDSTTEVNALTKITAGYSCANNIPLNAPLTSVEIYLTGIPLAPNCVVRPWTPSHL